MYVNNIGVCIVSDNTYVINMGKKTILIELVPYTFNIVFKRNSYWHTIQQVGISDRICRVLIEFGTEDSLNVQRANNFVIQTVM